MATNEKAFLDFEGLSEYNRLIKEYVDAKTTGVDATLQQQLINDLAVLGQKVNGTEETEGSIAYKINIGLEETRNYADTQD